MNKNVFLFLASWRPFRLKLTEYYWYGLKQCIPRVFDDFLIRPKIRLMGPLPFLK